MKNKYIYSIFVVFLSLAITSCSDFLSEDPKGVLVPQNFFKNAAEVSLAINGLHANAAGLPGGALGSDIAVSGRDVIAPGFVVHNYDYSDTNATVVNTWGGAFSNIKDANFAIASINASSLSDDIKQKAIAEAYFYRALYYFNHTLLYGDIPYWRDELDIDKVALLGTTSAAVIQQEMIYDLNIAIASGKMSTLAWKSNTGRPSVWAARMLKANICMWLKQWSEAKAELLEITTSASSPYTTSGTLTSALSSDYARMYRQGNELDSEIIFGQQYLATIINNTGHAVYHFQTANENTNAKTAMAQAGVWTSSAAFTIRKSFANTYSVTDKRKKYNVWENYTLTNGTVATFNFIYIPKMMRSTLPVGDPLMTTADASGISSATNRIFILSDAYLLLAEAEFMLNGSTQVAVDAINKIRSVARTGLTPYTTITLQDIQNERGWELTVEGYFGRKRDFIRWGILESKATATAAAEIAAGAYSLAITRANAEAAVLNGAPKGKYYIWPIPNADLLRSQQIGGALEQNPFWK